MCADFCVEFLSVNDSEIRGMHSSPPQRTPAAEEEGRDPAVLHCTVSHSASEIMRLHMTLHNITDIRYNITYLYISKHCLIRCKHSSFSLISLSWQIPQATLSDWPPVWYTKQHKGRLFCGQYGKFKCQKQGATKRLISLRRFILWNKRHTGK